MSKITSHKESLRIELSSIRNVNIRLGRDKEVILSVDSLEIDYSWGGVLIDGESRYLWRVGLSGWYPLDKPQAVCECSPGAHKTRQGHTETYRSEYERDALSVPYWVREIVVEHVPAWFIFERQICVI